MLAALRCTSASLAALVRSPRQPLHQLLTAARQVPSVASRLPTTATHACCSHTQAPMASSAAAISPKAPGAALLPPSKSLPATARHCILSPTKALPAATPSPLPLKQASTSCMHGATQQRPSVCGALFAAPATPAAVASAHARSATPIMPAVAATASAVSSHTTFSSVLKAHAQPVRGHAACSLATAAGSTTGAAASAQLEGAFQALQVQQQQQQHSAVVNTTSSSVVLRTVPAIDDVPLEPQLHLASYATHRHSNGHSNAAYGSIRHGSNGRHYSTGQATNTGGSCANAPSSSSSSSSSCSTDSSSFAQLPTFQPNRGLGEGHVHIITGPMFAGKSTALLHHVTQAHDRGAKVAVVKSSKDSRYARHWVVTHAGNCVRCFTAASLLEFVEQLGPVYESYDVVAIDEAQFFPDLVDFCRRAADVDGKVVFVAGLFADYMCRPFGQVLELMPFAEKIEKLKATCHYCNSPEGHFSVRLVDTEEQEVVGGADKYRAACRRCYAHHSVPEAADDADCDQALV